MSGISKDKIQDYWANRVAEQGINTVREPRQRSAVDNPLFAERKALVASVCPTDLLTLDYGCGIGRFADMFPRYVGYDIADKLLEIAREHHPDKAFIQLEQPYLPETVGIFELFLAVTVLQHADDPAVLQIFESLAKYGPKRVKLCLYENVPTQSRHMRGRTPAAYVNLLRRAGLEGTIIKQNSHVLHKVEHAVALIDARVV